ncbi:MAG TPA: hypothetical protein VFV92_03500 [Candidatus Bathyarchaeia archaeon]|nr:hypothetical protein [Candidatus Bathyarchaeia archaeon]
MEPVKVEKGSGPAGLWPVFPGLVLVLAFFLAHQAWSTGFFTSSFGVAEGVLFYGALLTGFIPPVLGSLHLNKRTELIALLVTAIFWSGASAWLLYQFPFNFSQLTAVMPGPLRFFLDWVTNGIGRILVGVALVGALAFIPFYTKQYSHLSRNARMSAQ